MTKQSLETTTPLSRGNLALESSGTSTRDPLSPHVLRALRCEPVARLKCIEEICRTVLGDALCEHMVESSGPDADDFVTVVRELAELCVKAAQFLRDSFGNHRLEQPDRLDPNSLDKDVHDFKNLVSGISYRCQFLIAQSDERFLHFVEDFKEIELHFRACLAALDQARGVVAKRAVATPQTGYVPTAQDGPPAIGIQVPARNRGTEPGRILIVDDEEDVRRHLTLELERQGHVAISAQDADQAMKLLETRCYSPDADGIDLVLLDLRLGDSSGLDVLDRMKKDYGLRSIPVVIVSASDDLDCVVQCLGAGADDYLIKPFETRLLQARVAASLATRRLQKREKRLTEKLRTSKDRANNLLYRIFPYTVAEELITSGAVKPRGCDHVAVMFCDVVGFTTFCNGRSPEEVVSHLDELFTAYEAAVSRYHVEKIKTIGDCMMITAGLMQRHDNPVLSCLRCGVEMLEAAHHCQRAWEIRIGIHAGPVVAGMAGDQHYAFDVWGDAVNTASRVESAAEPGTICVSEPAWAQVYHCCKGHSLGLRPLKGLAAMEVFRFEGFRGP